MDAHESILFQSIYCIIIYLFHSHSNIYNAQIHVNNYRVSKTRYNILESRLTLATCRFSS